MVSSVVVTDVTPLGKGGLLCVTGVNMATGRNVRPQPYFSERSCASRGIEPGADLEMEGDFYGDPPFVEDFFMDRLRTVTPSSTAALKKALELSCRGSLSREFLAEIVDHHYVREEEAVRCSLVTVRCPRSGVKIMPDRHSADRFLVRVVFRNAHMWLNLPLVEWTWYRAGLNNRADAINELHARVLRYEELYLRLCLARTPENGMRLIQVAGICGV